MQPPEEHRRRAPRDLRFSILTVSDSRTPATDEAGDRIARLVAAAGHRVSRRRLVADRIADIRTAAGELLAEGSETDVLVVTGGTGYAPRDLTPEAVAPLFDRRLEGFGELFRALSFAAIGPAAMLSRAAAGLVGPRAVFLLPGSPAAVELAVERLILPEAGHLLGQARRPG